MSEAVELELLPVNPCTRMRGLPTVRYEEPVFAHGRQGVEAFVAFVREAVGSRPENGRAA